MAEPLRIPGRQAETTDVALTWAIPQQRDRARASSAGLPLRRMRSNHSDMYVSGLWELT